MQPDPNPRRRIVFAHLEQAPGGLDLGAGTPPRDEGAREHRNPPASAPPAFDAPAPTEPSGGAPVRLTWQNQGKRHPTPRSRRTARTMITATQCRCARTLLRWSVSKLSSAASVSQSAIHDFELERRQPSTTTTDAIRRAFEGVGVVFLPQDDVQLRERRVARAATASGRGSSGSLRPSERCMTRSPLAERPSRPKAD